MNENDMTLKKDMTAEVIRKYSEFIKETTTWVHTQIGDVYNIKDITSANGDDSLDDIFLRDISIEIKVLKKEYFDNTDMLLENIEVKKLVLYHKTKGGLLSNSLISPIINKLDEENMIEIKAKMQMNWTGDIQKFFDSFCLYKSDIEKYFSIKTYKNISEGIKKNTIMNKDILKVLLGENKIKKLNLDDSIKSNYFKELDSTKENIYKTTISDNDIVLIKGPPGTGKTKIISQLIKHYIYEKKDTIILASRTHAALDNVIENISITTSSKNYSGIILEKSSYSEVNKEYTSKDALIMRNIRSRILEHMTPNGEISKFMKKNVTAKSNILNLIHAPKINAKAELFVGTISSTKFERMIQEGAKFSNSILIMDEVSKSSIIDVLRYALYCKKIILVGDDMQLGPIPINKSSISEYTNGLAKEEFEIFEQIFEKSVFKRLFNKDTNKMMLSTTYRSPKYILDLYNPVAYENKIQSMVHDVIPMEFRKSKTHPKLVDIYSKANLILLNKKDSSHTQDQKMSQWSKINYEELEVLENQLSFLSSSLKDASEKDVMVMFAYKDQYKNFFRKNNKKIRYYQGRYKSFKCGTIDQLQGTEADIVYICTTYAKRSGYLSSMPKYKIQLQDIRRLNVALSRSKQKIILILNYNTYRDGAIFDEDDQVITYFHEIFKKFDVKVNI